MGRWARWAVRLGLALAPLWMACGGGGAARSCRQVCEAQRAREGSVDLDACVQRCIAPVVRMRGDAGTVLLSCLYTLYSDPDASVSGTGECLQAAIDSVSPTPAARAYAEDCAARRDECAASGEGFGEIYCRVAPALLDATVARAEECLRMACPQSATCLRDATGGL
jgi:hypothetical protein